jgi:hypothetical protein
LSHGPLPHLAICRSLFLLGWYDDDDDAKGMQLLITDELGGFRLLVGMEHTRHYSLRNKK